MSNQIQAPYKGLTKVIQIVDPQTGLIKETEYEHVPGNRGPQNPQPVMESLGLQKYAHLEEAANTADFPVLLRDGLKQILFNSYAELPTTYQEWVAMETSNKAEEYYVEMNRLGTLPIVPEGGPYPEVDVSVDRAIAVRNNKRGYIFAITREMIKFDRSNQMRQMAGDMGAAAKQTREEQAYAVLSTTANYTRNSTTGDNDIGANTLTETFSGNGLIKALATLRTMKDRKTGRYLGVNPNLLIVAPRLEFAAKQLLLSPTLITRTGASEVYGMGGDNPFRGMVNSIIVSPFLGTSYQWCLMQAKRAVVYQEVEPLELLVEDVRSQQNEGYFRYDKISYRVSDWYGVGMMNDRFAFYSDSTTAPTVA